MNISQNLTVQKSSQHKNMKTKGFAGAAKSIPADVESLSPQKLQQNSIKLENQNKDAADQLKFKGHITRGTILGHTDKIDIQGEGTVPQGRNGINRELVLATYSHPYVYKDDKKDVDVYVIDNDDIVVNHKNGYITDIDDFTLAANITYIYNPNLNSKIVSPDEAREIRKKRRDTDLDFERRPVIDYKAYILGLNSQYLKNRLVKNNNA